MEQRIEIIFGKAKPYDLESSILLDTSSPVICAYKYAGKIVLLTNGKIFCSEPDEVLALPKGERAEEFSQESDIINFINTGCLDSRFEKQYERFESFKSTPITRKPSRSHNFFNRRKSSLKVIIN
jgi:hypothetical protein